MNLKHAHPWNLSPHEDRQIQETLRTQVSVQPLPEKTISLIAGLDASYGRNEIHAVAVVLDYATLERVE